MIHRLFRSACLAALSFILIATAKEVLAGQGQKTIPRPEHPKPQFRRDNWLNLNGEWNFAIDNDLSGAEKGWPQDPSAIDRKIIVPFCPESKLSGIGNRDFMNAVWYHRKVSIPRAWDGSRIFLHFGGVDYDCRVWINGILVGRHYGGSTSFAFEITSALKPGENDLVVCAIDDIRSGVQPSGKQSYQPESFGVYYTRVTGIWQTVWLEARPWSFIESVRIVPDLDQGAFILTPVIQGSNRQLKFQATLYSAEGKKVVAASSVASSGVPVVLKIKRPRSWSPENPYLYDLRFELLEGRKVIDQVASYAGLRKIHIEGNRLYLNNKPIFLRFVLDQGYYPDGVWTAPSDETLKNDIVLSMAVGFNGARLHQKVFEERFHYWADRLGYLTWGEFADWGLGRTFDNPQAVHNYQTEWREAVMRDLNHPSIITWTPYNETRRGTQTNLEGYRRAAEETVVLTRALDATRPINDASGYVHVITDIFTVHDYDQNPETFSERYAPVALDEREKIFIRFPEFSSPYLGQPYVVDEYGGTFWTKDYTALPPAEQAGGVPKRNKWGCGKTADEIEDQIEALTRVLLNHPHISGFTYTQLTDVEQEVNGIYYFDRSPKFNAERLKQIFGAPAAIEQQK